MGRGEREFVENDNFFLGSALTMVQLLKAFKTKVLPPSLDQFQFILAGCSPNVATVVETDARLLHWLLPVYCIGCCLKTSPVAVARDLGLVHANSG